MSATMTIKFKNIKGCSSLKPKKLADKATESFDILSWNWGMSQSASAHVSKGASQGSADVRDLTFTKLVDKASPTIIQDCFGGKDQQEVTLVMWKTSNGATWPYVQIVMSGIVFISSYHTGDIGPNDQLMETVTLNFAKAKVTFTPAKDSGDPDADVESNEMKIAEKCG